MFSWRFPSSYFSFLPPFIATVADLAAHRALQAAQRAARAAARNQLRAAVEGAPPPPLPPPVFGPLLQWEVGDLPPIPGGEDDALDFLDFDLLIPLLEPDPPLLEAMGEPGEILEEAMQARIKEAQKALHRNPSIPPWATAKVAARHYAKRLKSALEGTNITSVQIIRKHLLPSVFPAPADSWLVHQPADASLDGLLTAFVAEYDPLGSPAKAQNELATFQREPTTRTVDHLTLYDEILQAAFPTQAGGETGLATLRGVHLHSLKNSLRKHHPHLFNDVRLQTTYNEVVDIMQRDEQNPRLSVDAAIIAEMGMEEADPQTIFIPAQPDPPHLPPRGNRQPFQPSPSQAPPPHLTVAALTLQLEEMQGTFTSQIAALQLSHQQEIEKMQRYQQTERDRLQRDLDEREQKLRQEQQQMRKLLDQQSQANNKQPQGGYNGGRQFNQGPRGSRSPRPQFSICGRYYTDALGMRAQCQGTDHVNSQHNAYMASLQQQQQQSYLPPRLQGAPVPPPSVAYAPQVQTVSPPSQGGGSDHSTALVGALVNALQRPSPSVYMPQPPMPYYGMPQMGMAPYGMQMQGPLAGFSSMMNPHNFLQLGYQRDAASPQGNRGASS